MSSGSDHHHSVRRVVLPSGKTIEVVYFEDQAAAARLGATPVEQPIARQVARELHVCPDCESHLVYPVEWQEAGPTHWEVELRCPNCEWYGSDVFEQEAVERFDEELDRGTEAVVRDLKRLMHANMEDEIVRFVDALHAGHIQPEDF